MIRVAVLTSCLLACVPASAKDNLREVRDAWRACRFAEAHARLAKLPSAIRNEPETRYVEARVRVQLGEFSAALSLLDELKRSATKRVNMADLEIERALALSGLGKSETAMEAVDAANRLGQDKALVAWARALVWLEAGDVEKGLQSLQLALRLDPHQSGALFNLGVVMAEREDFAAAQQYISKAWDEGLRDPEEIRKEPRLQKMVKKGMLDKFLNDRRGPFCDTW